MDLGEPYFSVKKYKVYCWGLADFVTDCLKFYGSSSQLVAASSSDHQFGHELQAMEATRDEHPSDIAFSARNLPISDGRAQRFCWAIRF